MVTVDRDGSVKYRKVDEAEPLREGTHRLALGPEAQSDPRVPRDPRSADGVEAVPPRGPAGMEGPVPPGPDGDRGVLGRRTAWKPSLQGESAVMGGRDRVAKGGFRLPILQKMHASNIDSTSASNSSEARPMRLVLRARKSIDLTCSTITNPATSDSFETDT